MISFTTLQNNFGTLTQNSSTANLALGAQLMNIEHRYLLQKYFSNEASYSITTVGSQSLTLTGSLSSGATSATLSSAWLYYTTTVQVTFSNSEIRNVNVQKGSTSIVWDAPLTSSATTAITVGGIQTYPLPSDYSKIKTGTLTIGNLRWNPREIASRQEWDDLNVFPYYADIPNNYFVWKNQFNLWPIPSTTGNIISFNYKRRIPDLSISDYTTPGTVSVTKGSTSVTGSGTSFVPTVNTVSESRWIQFSQPTGDNLWYQIASIDSTTGITLATPYMGSNISGSSTYTIGQMPLLVEDFHDMLLWKALTYYFSSIVDNPKKKQEFEDAYNTKLVLLEEYCGTKTVDVNLKRPQLMQNPNLFVQNLS